MTTFGHFYLTNFHPNYHFQLIACSKVSKVVNVDVLSFQIKLWCRYFGPLFPKIRRNLFSFLVTLLKSIITQQKLKSKQRFERPKRKGKKIIGLTSKIIRQLSNYFWVCATNLSCDGNKLVRLSRTVTFKQGCRPSEGPLMEHHSKGGLQVLLVNIRLGRKWMNATKRVSLLQCRVELLKRLHFKDSILVPVL